MSKLGWSYPAGCGGTPYDVDLPPRASGNARQRRRALRATFERCPRHHCLAHYGECRRCAVEEAERLQKEELRQED